MRFLAFARNDITVILKGNTLKNLSPSEPIVRTLTYVRDDKRCHSDDRKRGRISFQRTSASGFLSLDHRSRFGTKNETELSYNCYRNVNTLHLSCNEKERLLLSKNYGNQMKRFTKIITVICLLLTMPAAVRCAVIKGTVKDISTGEPLAGATVSVVGTTTAAFTDETGSFELKNLKIGSYTLIINYISYQSETLSDLKVLESTPLVLDIRLKPDDQTLDEVVVVGQMRRNTELGMIAATKTSLVIQNGVSSQQIKIAQDKDASEAIRRVPGISIIDNKFVMVRGLSQRYNNVWINGSAVPSTEADSRAFSFDIIPSSQLENIAIVKSPAPEYPADFSGGFILLTTKDLPAENSFTLSVGGNINDATHFHDFKHNKGSKTDFLGFDNGLRHLDGGMDAALKPIAGDGIDLQGNGFNNDWKVRTMHPVGDLSISADVSRIRRLSAGGKIGLIGAINYSNSFKTYLDMENSMFGAYDTDNDRSNYLRRSVDDQYNHTARIGALLNITFIPKNENNRFEFKNIFNQIGTDRYTYRTGISAQNNHEENAEYYYSSRTTYNGQFTGKHTFENDYFDWSAGYAYANRLLPDRRKYLIDDALETGVLALSTGNDITREFTRLDEHIASANVNYRHDFEWGAFNPSIKAGAYGEYRTRSYRTRSFIYNWNYNHNTLPEGFRHMDLPTELLTDANYGADKLYLLEEVKMRNNYDGNNLLGAGYVGINLPWGGFNLYAGVRFEHNDMELIRNTRDYEKSPQSTHYKYNDFFPSVNATYKFNEEHQLRASYGKSVNRPEFREVSPSVFYDFDLASNVQGNTELRPCYVQNIDLRYEWYPTKGEQILVALDDPIEWTYTVTGGTDLVYSYRNADGAYSYGLEVDIRKNLAFMGMPSFDFVFNGALIKSLVEFPEGDREEDRPMQGQSPYLINTGLSYRSEKTSITAAVFYNRIGKRIAGVGRYIGSSGNEETVRIPDSYEMPRDAIDLSLSWKAKKHWEIKCGVRDLLADKVTFMQRDKITTKDGQKKEIEEITRQYKPGRNFHLSVSYTF